MDLRFSFSFRLGVVPPFDFRLTVRKPAGWPFLTPREKFENNTLWTVLRPPSGEMTGLKLKSLGTIENPKISCEIFSRGELDAKKRGELVDEVSWVLGAKDDLREFYSLADKDSLVKSLVNDLYGMKWTRRPDIFPSLTLAVTLQMAPIKRSQQMMDLLIENYGEEVRFDGKAIKYWPSAEKIAEVDQKELQERCKLGYRAKVLKGIAQRVKEGFPSPRELEKMQPEEAKAKLMELKGVGEYSADIVSPHRGFSLDVWSAKIFSLILLGKEAKNPREIIPQLRKVSEERWGRWRGYVFIYVVNDLDKLSKKYALNLNEV